MRRVFAVFVVVFLALACPAAHVPKYSRTEWHPRWSDADRDCQNTRTEVLVAESLDPVTYADQRHCVVAAGRWRDGYSGQEYRVPGELDIDHLVPLAWAHTHGGFAWPKSRKQLYANDLEDADHLIAVAASLNRSKGARGPDAWVPPDETAHCAYGLAWRAVTERWALALTWREIDAIAELIATCSVKAAS